MKRNLFIVFMALIFSILVFQTYARAEEQPERWVLLGESKSNGALYVEVTTYDPAKGAWYLFVREGREKEIVRIIDEIGNRAVCFNAYIDMEKKALYTLPEKQCAVASPETLSETIFMSLLVMRNEYEKRNGVKK